MDACDPGIDIKNLKTLIKQTTGEDIKLSRSQICDVYATIQDGKLPLPPLILSRDKSHLLDRKSPLTIVEFEKLFSSSTKVASIRRIAKKVGLARHADKSLTKAQLVDIIGRKLHSLNIHEPIRLRTVHKKKINVKPFNINSNSNNLMTNIKRENGINNSNSNRNITRENGINNSNSNRTNSNYTRNENNRNNNRGGNMFRKANKPNFLKNNSNTKTPYREVKGIERGRVKNMFSSLFSGGFKLKSQNEVNSMSANKRKFYLQKPEKLYTQLRNEGYIGNESFKDWHKRFKKAAKEHVGQINRGDYKDLINQVIKFKKSPGPLASQQQSRSNNVSGSTLSPTTPASSVQGPSPPSVTQPIAPTPRSTQPSVTQPIAPTPRSTQPSVTQPIAPTPRSTQPSVRRTLFSGGTSGNDNIKKQSILNKMREKSEERKQRAEERRRTKEAAAEARRQAKINKQKEINSAKNENNRKQKLKKAKYNNASGLRLNLNNQNIKNLINSPNVTLNNASNKFKNYKKKNHNKLNTFLKSNNGTLKLNENSIKELHNILNEPRSLVNTVKNAKQKIEQKFRNKENANTEARKQFIAELEQFASSRSLNKTSRDVQQIIKTQRNTKRNIQNGNSNKFAGKEITTAHRMIQKLANARNAKRIEEISKFLNENSNAKQFIKNSDGIKRRVLAEPKTSIKDIISDIKKDIKGSQNQGIKANANALRANYTDNANAKTVINNFESRKRIGRGIFSKGEIKYPTKQSVINAIEQKKKNNKNKSNKNAINKATEIKKKEENNAKKAANKETREANINELKTNARYQNEKYQKIIQNYVNQKTRMFSSKPIYPNKQSVRTTLNKKISNNQVKQAQINAKKLSSQELKQKMEEKGLQNEKMKEERLARAEELKTYITSLNGNNFKAQDFRTNGVVTRVISGGITNISLAKKEVNAIVTKRKGKVNVKKQKNANVAELRNKYGNNANAKKVINKFAKGGLLAPKTRENASKIINKKIEDRKGKAIAQQKILENAERNSAAFDEFLKTFVDDTLSEQQIKSLSPIPRLVGKIKKGRYELKNAKTRAETAIKGRKKAILNGKQAAANAKTGGGNSKKAFLKAQEEKAQEKADQTKKNANEALKKKNELAKKADASKQNAINKQKVANVATNATNAINKRNEQEKKAAAARQNAINKQKIANSLKAKANAIQKRRNLELQEKQRKLEEKKKANENAKKEKEKVNQNAKNAIKRNEEAKAKKEAANKKVQNLKILEKMLSTSTLPINAQQRFRNRVQTESLNKFKTNVITAIKDKRKLNKTAETRKEREKLKEQENQRKQLLLQAKQKEEQNKKQKSNQNYANKKQKALNKISSLTFNENKKRNLLNNVRRETIGSQKPLTNFTLAAERYANQFSRNKKKAAFNAKREAERKKKEQMNQSAKEQKERNIEKQKELKQQQSNKAAANASAAANKKKEIEEERKRKRQEKNQKQKIAMEEAAAQKKAQIEKKRIANEEEATKKKIAMEEAAAQKKRNANTQHARLMEMKQKALREKAEKKALNLEKAEKIRKEMEIEMQGQRDVARKREKNKKNALERKAAANKKAAENKAAANKKAAENRAAANKKAAANKAASNKAAANKAAANKATADEKKRKMEEMRAKAQKIQAEKKARAEKAAANRKIAIEKKAAENKAAAIAKAKKNRAESNARVRQKRLNNIRTREISGGNKVVNEATQRLQKRVDKFVPSGWAGGRRREFMNRAKRMGVMSVHANLNARLRLKKQINKSVRSNKKNLLNQIHDPKYTIAALNAKVRKPPPPPLNT